MTKDCMREKLMILPSRIQLLINFGQNSSSDQNMLQLKFLTFNEFLLYLVSTLP